MQDDQTIGKLARQHNLSRSTLLYYDRIGLLRPKNRSAANYRFYSQVDVQRLRQICLYRQLGLSLKEIGRLLSPAGAADPPAAILRARLASLEREVATLRDQEAQIVRLLQQMSSRNVRGRRRKTRRATGGANGTTLKSKRKKEVAVVNKERWVEIMRAAGFSEKAMRDWHHQFETMEPHAHQEFLESLGIAADEIAKIRKSAARG